MSDAIRPRRMWHVVNDDGGTSEETENALHKRIVDGSIRKDTWVWRPGMANWEPAGEVLEDLFTPPPRDRSRSSQHYRATDQSIRKKRYIRNGVLLMGALGIISQLSHLINPSHYHGYQPVTPEGKAFDQYVGPIIELLPFLAIGALAGFLIALPKKPAHRRLVGLAIAIFIWILVPAAIYIYYLWRTNGVTNPAD